MVADHPVLQITGGRARSEMSVWVHPAADCSGNAGEDSYAVK